MDILENYKAWKNGDPDINKFRPRVCRRKETTMREHRVPYYKWLTWSVAAEYLLIASVIVLGTLFGFSQTENQAAKDDAIQEMEYLPVTGETQPASQPVIEEVPPVEPSEPVMSITEEPRAFFGRPITPLAEQLFARIIIPSERMEIYMNAVAEVENSNTVGAAGELGRWQFTKDCWDEGWGFWIKSGLVKKTPAFTWDNCNNPTYAACVISGYDMRYEPEEWMFFCMNDNPGSVFVLAMLHHAGPSWRTKSKKKFEDASEYAGRVVNIVLFGKEVK